MTKRETAQLIAVIAEVYPRFMDGRNIETTVTLWQKMFAGDSYEEVNAAFLAFVATDEKGFPPAIGMLRSLLGKLRKPEGETTETEAWALVQKATSNSLYNADREFAALPEDVRQCVGSPAILREWGMMDAETFNSVVASNFMRGYRARAVHVREMQKLPASVREVFGLLGEAMRIPEARIEAPKPQAAPDEKPRYMDPAEGWKLAKARLEELRKQNQKLKLG